MPIAIKPDSHLFMWRPAFHVANLKALLIQVADEFVAGLFAEGLDSHIGILVFRANDDLEHPAAAISAKAFLQLRSGHGVKVAHRFSEALATTCCAMPTSLMLLERVSMPAAQLCHKFFTHCLGITEH